LESGYVKIYRSLWEKGYANKSDYVSLWVYLISHSNYCEKEVFINRQIITLKPGQFITGRSKLSKDTGVSETTIERVLKCFENEHQIGQQTFSKFRIITILNWDKYQVSGQENGQQTDSKRTANGQQTDTTKKDKKDKNISITDISFFESLKSTYTWVDYDAEMKKIDFWIANHPGRRKTRRFVMNWFNKIEKPLEGEVKKAWNS
jgi:hypothetical protein